jgi:peptidoglycan hydrolase-like protein with peptidoglycan-binding domain
MKLSYLLIIFSFFLSAQAVFADTVPVSTTSVSCSISSVLKMGSRGAEVQCLQEKIGVTTDGVFGHLTNLAVVTFQTAQGLKADGIIGPLSEAVLNNTVANNDIYPAGCISSTGYSIITGVKCDGSLNNKTVTPTPTPTPNSVPVVNNVSLNTNTTPLPSSNTDSTNPNFKNIDSYIAAVEEGALKGGLSADKLPLLKDKIMQEAESNNTSFLQQFFDNQKTIYEKKISENIPPDPLWTFLDKTVSFMDNVFSTKKAFASLGVPFGGFITYVNPVICDCPPGIITQIFVASGNPNPSQSNLLLDYLIGSQAFASYNIPLPSIAVLGEYEPGIVSCYSYVGYACIPIVSEGLISPVVGSSPL